ncbi:MAG: Gfo/Idh/MocA family oxidoreductase [Bryobacterales bacterium]|nr:Gfo/Idh/MocA family oxidoreductase [Bryobacterales bacterium]
MGKLRGAIAGCGFFGNIQIEAWRRMPDVDLIAACDPALERAQAAAARAYTDAAAMLDRERPDFLDIATRPDTHLALVRLAAERGIPAIVQKPLAETMEQGRELADFVEASGVPVMVHENWRWQPWYREVKRRMEGGDIGQPLTYTFRIRQRDGLGDNPYPNQPYFRQMPRLLLYETLIHPIDTARFLFGDIARLQAFAKRHNPSIAGEDRAVVLLEHANTADGVIDGSRYTNAEPAGPAMGDSIFEGTEGVLRVLANGEVYRGATLLTRHDTSTGYKGDSVFATQRHFIDCLRARAPFETGVREYLGSFAAVEGAYRSIAEGRVISLRQAD